LDNPVISDPHWVAGFTSGEGSFIVRIYESPAAASGSKDRIQSSVSISINST
jgi:hypothetical protein